MAKFLVCIEGDEDVIDDATVVDADTLDSAAEEYVRLNFSHLDYPEETTVFVKRLGTKDNPVKHTVLAMRDVRFVAKACKQQ